MAWADQSWILNGASVRISIVGFDDGSETVKMLDGAAVSHINANLSGNLDLSQALPLKDNKGLAFMGLTLSGPFDIPWATADSLLSAPVNVNGRPNSDVVKPYLNGNDVAKRTRDYWVIDFGTSMGLEAAAQYEAPFRYVLENVKPVREKNNREAYREKWWIHAEARSGLRKAIDGQHRYLATVLVSRHRYFVWVDSRIAPANRLIVVARDDDYFFGVLNSRLHEIWALKMGARHGVGNDPTYNNTTCFETFPLPWPPGQEPVDDPRVIAIGDAAKRLDELRTTWLEPEGASDAELKKRTLTNLYNARPTWLQNAHAALDRAVWDAYGWPADEVPAQVEEDVILSRLLELNQERAIANQN
jgi:hypothetical protein